MAELLPRHLAGFTTPGWVAWDTETSGLYADDGARVSTASVAFEDPDGRFAEFASYENVTYGEEQITDTLTATILSVAWPFDQGKEGKPEDDGQTMLWPEADNLGKAEWNNLLDFLAGNSLVAHNAKFDLEKMRVGVRKWPAVGRELQDNVVWDTQNVNHMLWPLHPTSLKPTCSRVFGKQWADEAAEVKRYLAKSKLPAGRWDLMPWSTIGKYADTDARITLMLALYQQAMIDQKKAGTWLGSPDDVYGFAQRRLEVMKVLYRMERRGLPYDEVMSREAGIECEARADRLMDKLPFDPRGAEAKKFFFEEGLTKKGAECLELVPYSVTEKGSPQLTAEIVTRMINDRIPHADQYGEWRRVTNAASMWYYGYADAMGTDGRLRTCFRQNGTRSSRFSVERVNLQAIPQDYRLSDHSALEGIPTPRQIIAEAVPDGWRIFELDLEQAELRVGTMYAGCTSMERMIREGQDLHTFTTEALFDARKGNPDWDKWRQVGKRANFSLLFGSGAFTFRTMVSKETGIILSDTEADRIVKEWNALYPEFGLAIKKHMRAVERRQSQTGRGWVTFVNGERRWFQPDEEAHKAFNQRVQGNLAQFGIDWLLRSDDLLRNERTLHHHAKRDNVGEVGLVLTIHDSQVLLLPDNEYGKELADQCAQFGRDLWKQRFPGIPGGVDHHEWMYS